MKMKRLLSLLLVTVMVLTCFASCKKQDEEAQTPPIKTPPTNEELIAERIETFLTAYNTGDMDAVMECLDAKTRNAFQAMLNLLGGVAGGLAGFDIDLSDLFSLGVGTVSGDFMGLQITDIDITNNTNATATTRMTLTGAGTQTIYFEMVYENNGWYIHDMTDHKPNSSNGSQEDSSHTEESTDTGDSANTGDNGNGSVVHNYKISTCEPFLNGRAWVKYYEYKANQYNSYYYGFIDMQGTVLYSTPANEVEIFNIGQGSGIVCSQSGLALIDKNGEVKLELTGSVEVKEYGNGYAWIYQNKSTITSLEHLYGVVNHNGEWIDPLQNLQEEGLYDKIKHLGDGFVCSTDRDSLIFPIWSVDKSIEIIIDGHVSDRHVEFKNGVALVDSSHYWDSTISVTVTKRNNAGESDTVVYKEIHGDCVISADGRVIDLERSLPILRWNKAFYNGKAITYMLDSESGVAKPYYQITDYTKATPTTVEFTAYPASQIENFVFNGNYALVQILGLDKEVYVTMIDMQGNELITPIKGMYLDEFVLTSDGYVYYRKNNTYHIVDKNNNVTETDIKLYVSFVDGSDVGMICDFLYARSYIKSNGEELFENLKLNK